MGIDELKIRIESFSELEKNWDGYDADEITIQSIAVANSVLDSISKTNDINNIAVFPMRDGGIQFEIGDFKEIEIFNYEIKEIEFDSEYNITNELKSVWKENI
jgi:hypothetical protein